MCCDILVHYHILFKSEYLIVVSVNYGMGSWDFRTTFHKNHLFCNVSALNYQQQYSTIAHAEC